MTLQDLQSLKLAIDTSNPGFYSGNMDDALSEVVEELLDLKQVLANATDHGVHDVEELVELYKGALNEVAKLEEDKENIMEVDFITCKIVGVERITERGKTFENLDPEHPVKVIVKEI